MTATAYDGIFGLGFAFTFTPTTGTPFGTAQAQVEEATTPPVKIETAKYTPISGANSGIEQFALGRYPVQDYKMKVTYSAAEHLAALACQAARIKGIMVCTYGDGSSETYSGAAITEVAAGPNTASGLRTADVTVTTPVPPVFSAGTAISVVNTTAILSVGAVTIDLTASPYSGNGKAPINAYFLNPLTNADSITITFGASDGYTGFGATFETTLVPGQSCSLNSAVEIGSGAKNLDITGTGSQVLVVQMQLQ